VLRAYDPKLQREVALKEVRGDALGHGGARRLVAEARAMAKLSHPNVVAVFDVEEVAADTGRERGPHVRLVLVMEYVAGQTLQTWLAAQPRSWRAVVGCFIAAGHGLAAAHAAGLLHRDFKPTNVLVVSASEPERSERAGGTTIVKVTDFGLAKLAGSASTSDPGAVRASGDDSFASRTENLTEAGTVMGTPRYMAPEQHHGEPLAPAADQYAFCVALWEALCGEAPFSCALAKSEGPPPWPGGPTPRPVAEAVRRGLSPDPMKRWPSMHALLQALAYDPARRRKRSLLALGGLGMAAMGVMAWQSFGSARALRCTPASADAQLSGVWDGARRAEAHAAIVDIGASYATEVWQKTAATLDAYAADWTAMHVETCAAATIRGEQSTQVMDLRMACLHRAKVDLQAVTAILADADAAVVSRAHELTATLRPLSRCADVPALQAEVEPPLPDDVEAVESIRAHLAATRKAGRYPQARAEVEAAKQSLEHVGYGPVRTEVALVEGNVLNDLGDYAASETAYREALRLAATFRQWGELGDAAIRLVWVVGYQQRRFEEALRYNDLAEGPAQGDPLRMLVWRDCLASVLHAQGKTEEAEAEHRRVLAVSAKMLGPDHPSVVASRNNLATVLQTLGRYEEAEAENRRVLALREAALGPEHPYVAASHNNLANALYALERYDEAEAELRRALALREKALGLDHPEVAATRNNLSLALHALGKPAEAEAELRGALAVSEKMLGPDHPEVALLRSNLAVMLSQQGKHAEAEAELRRALAVQEKALGPDHSGVIESRRRLAEILLARDEAGQAP
jgi:serine/threonine-protein kinase